jgi:DNA-binding NarL/FixJ family response regulator
LKRRIFQGLDADAVRFFTRRVDAPRYGTLTAKGAVAMTNVVNILLLDEEDLMREATALLLVNRGAHVEKTKTIEEAMAQLERQTFDVIVVDVAEKSADHERWVSRVVASASSCKRIVICTDKPLANLPATLTCRVLVKPYPFDRFVDAVFGTRPGALRSIRSSVKPLGRRTSSQRRVPMAMRRGRA